jgi:phage repressor protein C with HTH and peptisase S24 domain
MEPRFKDRQQVVLRDKATLKRPVLKYGELYCFVHEGQATFKQWAKDSNGSKVLRSLNSEHPDIIADDQTDWIGWFDKADNA